MTSTLYFFLFSYLPILLFLFPNTPSHHFSFISWEPYPSHQTFTPFERLDGSHFSSTPHHSNTHLHSNYRFNTPIVPTHLISLFLKIYWPKCHYILWNVLMFNLVIGYMNIFTGIITQLNYHCCQSKGESRIGAFHSQRRPKQSHQLPLVLVFVDCPKSPTK